MVGAVFYGLMLLIVLGSSTAQDQNCCTPDQWEGLISITSGSSETAVQYFIDLKTKKCTVSKESTPFPKFCIPDSYKKVGDFTLGAATESLPVSLYEYKYKEPNATAQSSVIFTRDLCIPVSELHSEQFNKESVVAAAGYVDIKLGISDQSVFTVPLECQSHTTLFAEKRSAKFQRWRFLASPFLHL